MSETAAANTKRRILIIEDDKTLLNLLTQHLTEAGYHVEKALDGMEGLESIREKTPDVVLLDMLMPRKDGFGVLDALTEEGLLPNLPVIIISNSGQPVEIQRAKDYGIRDYLIKLNFDPEEVQHKVDAVLAAEAAPAKKPESDASEVLMVEDDTLLATLLSQALQEKGFVVHPAVTAEQARYILESYSIDCICLDIVLPEEDGFSLLKELKGDERYADIPVLIISNLGQPDEIKKGKELGAAGYIIKATAFPEELAEKVATLLNK